MSVVGESIPRLDAREKVSGRAQYIADLYRPGMLHGAILGSPHAHARIKSYDARAAKQLPGVVSVLTEADLKGGKFGPFIKDETVLAIGKVRYVGEPVCIVAAEDERTARRAALMIEVEYEELPAVLTPVEAMAEFCSAHSRGKRIRISGFTKPRAAAIWHGRLPLQKGTSIVPGRSVI